MAREVPFAVRVRAASLRERTRPVSDECRPAGRRSSVPSSRTSAFCCRPPGDARKSASLADDFRRGACEAHGSWPSLAARPAEVRPGRAGRGRARCPAAGVPGCVSPTGPHPHQPRPHPGPRDAALRFSGRGVPEPSARGWGRRADVSGTKKTWGASHCQIAICTIGSERTHAPGGTGRWLTVAAYRLRCARPRSPPRPKIGQRPWVEITQGGP